MNQSKHIVKYISFFHDTKIVEYEFKKSNFVNATCHLKIENIQSGMNIVQFHRQELHHRTPNPNPPHTLSDNVPYFHPVERQKYSAPDVECDAPVPHHTILERVSHSQCAARRTPNTRHIRAVGGRAGTESCVRHNHQNVGDSSGHRRHRLRWLAGWLGASRRT